MFEKILIANRGEIAGRVMRTCRRLGVRTVAVYSDADRHALHTTLADEAVRLGPPAARDSYLKIDAVIDAARRTGARAIHPGYGFLSENADFAQACEAAGIVFIGPPAQAIRDMGSKSAAKQIMERAGVPLVPGYHGDDQSDARLRREADRIGYPVLIKAVSGGGGKGMRRVDAGSEFADALQSARREGAAAFGDERVLVEKYIEHPRHIEVQVFADTHGAALHLFERDCSVQRRHQKVLEEAPAPGVDAALRQRMGQTAVEAALAIGYVGAGTVEFITDAGGTFYFMEMNTRLQVEHPVTEMITGQDLVEWQLRVADGQPLPCAQDGLTLHGHAFEARIYAEDAERDFLPATGTVAHLREPQAPGARIDSAVREGDEIGLHYDPMIAKLVCWGEDRATALQRLHDCLRRYQIAGVTTNLGFLARVAAQPDFAAGGVSTDFIDTHRDALFAPPPAAGQRVLAAACLHETLALEARSASRAATGPDPHSPWHAVDGWEPNAEAGLEWRFREGDTEHAIVAFIDSDGWRLAFADGTIVSVRVWSAGERDLRIEADGFACDATVVAVGEERHVFVNGAHHVLVPVDPLAFDAEHATAEGSLTAPMPGTVIGIAVAAGDAVESGQTLVTLEAMKMEYTVTAPGCGVVESVLVAVGEQVADGAELLRLAAADD